MIKSSRYVSLLLTLAFHASSLQAKIDDFVRNATLIQWGLKSASVVIQVPVYEKKAEEVTNIVFDEMRLEKIGMSRKTVNDLRRGAEMGIRAVGQDILNQKLETEAERYYKKLATDSATEVKELKVQLNNSPHSMNSSVHVSVQQVEEFKQKEDIASLLVPPLVQILVSAAVYPILNCTPIERCLTRIWDAMTPNTIEDEVKEYKSRLLVQDNNAQQDNSEAVINEYRNGLQRERNNKIRTSVTQWQGYLIRAINAGVINPYVVPMVRQKVLAYTAPSDQKV